MDIYQEGYNVHDFYSTRKHCVFCTPFRKACDRIKIHNELVREKSSWSYSITKHDISFGVMPW